jgi:hypothetical protein
MDNAQKHNICRLDQHLMQSTFKLWFSSLAPDDGIMPEVDNDHFLSICSRSPDITWHIKESVTYNFIVISRSI